MKNIVYIGMDVHKETFNLCALNGVTGEILGEARCASDVKLVKKFGTNRIIKRNIRRMPITVRCVNRQNRTV
ncbi:hypothetical protein [Enterococcus faecalis]|uniref:hypothetical protein n=1 Tax=Enterococcus faecalis TaxID=1351 RepID=UPI0030C83FEE